MRDESGPAHGTNWTTGWKLKNRQPSGTFAEMPKADAVESGPFLDDDVYWRRAQARQVSAATRMDTSGAEQRVRVQVLVGRSARDVRAEL